MLFPDGLLVGEQILPDLDGPDVCTGENARQVVGLHIPDTGIRRTRDLTAGDHVPDCDMMPGNAS